MEPVFGIGLINYEESLRVESMVLDCRASHHVRLINFPIRWSPIQYRYHAILSTTRYRVL